MSEVKFDDQSSTKQRSWLNLLSMGMLGAAGSVAASEQFAGVVPDEIIEVSICCLFVALVFLSLASRIITGILFHLIFKF